jgi:hypothetical protein
METIAEEEEMDWFVDEFLNGTNTYNPDME